MNSRRLGSRRDGTELKRGTLLKQTSYAGKELRRRFLGDHHQVDKETGQVYSEVTASIQSYDDRRWARQAENVAGYRDRDVRLAFYGGSSKIGASFAETYLDGVKRIKRARGCFGARSLQDVAIDCILENITDVTYEGMECLPDPLVRRLWHSVNTRRLLSFNTWLLFSKVFRNGPNPTLNIFRFRKNIEKPLSPLTTYIHPLTSPTFDFITSLSLTKTYDIPDLVRLSSITNLGVLEILNSPKQLPLGITTTTSPVNNRVIRAWHNAAENEGAFRVLRLLKLWNCGDVTAESLPYLLAFPILALFDVRGCGICLSACTEAKSLGWKAILESHILEVLEKECVQRAQQLNPDFLGRRIETQQLPDDLPTQKISRSEVPAFLTRQETAKMGGTQLSNSSCKSVQYEADKGMDERLAGKSRQEARKEAFKKPQRNTTGETWEFDTYTTFSKLGELRNDTDLAATGIDVAEHAVIAGSDLVCPVPIVSLRLGPDIVRKSRDRGTALAFLRLELPTPVVNKNLKHSLSLGHESKSAPGLGKAKRRKTQVKETKKKDMTDLLNSFY